ncbi:MAG: hypothetical protein VYC62_05765 [Verrucomicrobiota bacterium]|nr:hypothetical protein [Verrucomicrobiota bacterium]
MKCRLLVKGQLGDNRQVVWKKDRVTDTSLVSAGEVFTFLGVTATSIVWAI